ncbi:unnamed protein product [Rotaria sp. Silwood1]|nr:unnamed protein product [Rotaria sp. Silwood1]CAF4960103.1 unnamed protein product [Rotaria sp. Silwood1]
MGSNRDSFFDDGVASGERRSEEDQTPSVPATRKHLSDDIKTTEILEDPITVPHSSLRRSPSSRASSSSSSSSSQSSSSRSPSPPQPMVSQPKTVTEEVHERKSSSSSSTSSTVSFESDEVDAFTDKLFGGNPAAVCPLDKWLPDSLMQQIAAENNLAETAFFVPNSNNDGYELRWFTPELEMDLCGHATLAAAHIIFTEMSSMNAEINFLTKKAGELRVIRQKEDALYTLDFPARPAAKVDLPDGLLSALCSNVTPIEVYKARDHMLVYEKEADVKQLSPDFMALVKIDSVFGVIATAPGDEVDFVSRFFAPSAGVPEDPVTGSAHCSLIPYWGERLGKNQLHAYQISARKGELWCENQGDRVLMSGKAVTYLKGEIDV